MNNKFLKVHNERNGILLRAWMQRKQQQNEIENFLISKQFCKVSAKNCVKDKRSVYVGLKFHNPAPEQQVMSIQCWQVFCYSCIAATLNERKACPMCCEKQTIQNIRVLYV